MHFLRTRLLSLTARAGAWRWLLVLALLNGLLYFAVVPPWWHYDEPGHFEYAWLAANRPGWPRQGERDEAMRRRMALSMEQAGWYAPRNYKLNLSSNKPVWIGVPQTGGRPGYYFMASLPLRLVRGAPITLQYDVARLASLLMYLLTVLLIWKAAGELLGEGHPLQWLTAGFVALLPAFTDVMVSVSDDVGAILAGSLFLWLSLRLLKRGPSAAGLAGWAASLLACYFAKNTAWFGLALAPFVLAFALLHGRRIWLVWAVTPLLVLAAGFALFTGGGAASWYQDPGQAHPLRVRTTASVLEPSAFQVDYSGGRLAAQTGQLLSPDLVQSLRGKTLTLGAWVWSAAPSQGEAPSMLFATEHRGLVPSLPVSVQVGPQPAFQRSIIEVPSDATYAMVLMPSITPAGGNSSLFVDGMVLVQGSHASSLPGFADASAKRGTWDGQPFTSLIENGSAEQGSLRVRPSIDKRIGGALGHIGRLSTVVSLIGDWRGTSWYYAETFATLFRTFWTSLGADKFNLPGSASTYILLALTALGVLGSARLAWRKRQELHWDIVYVLGAALLLAWGFTLIRGLNDLLSGSPTFPWSRYAFPAILPAALLICAGWLDWLRTLHIPDEFARLLPLGLMAWLSAWCLLNVLEFFHPSLAGREWLFWLGSGLGLVLLAALGKAGLRRPQG